MFKKNLVLFARKKPGTRLFPNDFDMIAENILDGVQPSELKEVVKPKIIPTKEKLIDFVGIDEPLFNMNNNRAGQGRLKKQSTVQPIIPAPQPMISTKPTGTKPLVNELYQEETNEELEWFENKVLNTNTQEEPRWLKAAQIALQRQHASEDIAAVVKTGPVQLNEIVEVLEKESGMNIIVIDVTEKCDHMQALVICEGRTVRHAYSLADAVKRLAKHRYTFDNGLPENLAVQGTETEWMVVDLGSFMVHCFTPECRKEVDLEGVWLHNDEFESGIVETDELEPLNPFEFNHGNTV
jgi:ribosome-associated protein